MKSNAALKAKPAPFRPSIREEGEAILSQLRGGPLPRGYKETLYRLPPSPDEMRQVRKTLGYSQDGMARLFNTPKKTWQNWEQGLSRPGGAETVLFQLILRDAAVLKAMVELAELDFKSGELKPYQRR